MDGWLVGWMDGAMIPTAIYSTNKQVGLMDPANVRHRRERPGYVENLYGWGSK